MLEDEKEKEKAELILGTLFALCYRETKLEFFKRQEDLFAWRISIKGECEKRDIGEWD